MESILFITLFFYLIPTWVALGRKHHQTLAIFLLNLFLGWTLIGWVGALVWSATAIKRRNPDGTLA